MKRCASVCLFVSVAACSHAAPVIAILTSASPFMLERHVIDTPGVTSFPLVVGDTVITSNGAAVVFFQDRSRVKLAVHSSIRLAGTPAKPKLVLLSGSLDYRLVRGSILAVTNLDIERKQAQQGAQPAGISTAPVRALPPERAMLAALDSPAPVMAQSHASANADASAPSFLIPDGQATSLIRLPPVSRRY